MNRFGTGRYYSDKIQSSTISKLYYKIFGNIEITSSHYHFIRSLKSLKRGNEIKTILDAGCGNGDYTFWTAKQFSCSIIDAVDLSADILKVNRVIRSKLKLNNINFIKSDLLDYRKENFYDLVYSNHVLEHIKNNHVVIQNMISSLKPGGFIYIQMPSKDYRQFFWGKRFLSKHIEWAKNEHIGLRYNIDDLINEVKDSGCEIIKAKYVEGYLGELCFELSEMARSYYNSNTLFALLLPLLKLLSSIDSYLPHSSGNGLLVLARKMK
ncbi:MAG: class I SAM-dependent methyltransferase [candidate division Zixibacteria bacterium]|nr:class I SAM-dependent methyltransferase [candidate division Zixibacteria bacterium]